MEVLGSYDILAYLMCQKNSTSLDHMQRNGGQGIHMYKGKCDGNQSSGSSG